MLLFCFAFNWSIAKDGQSFTFMKYMRRRKSPAATTALWHTPQQ